MARRFSQYTLLPATLLVCMLLTAACGGPRQATPQIPEDGLSESDRRPLPEPQRVEVGDKLEVVVYLRVHLHRTFTTVRPDGRISLPLIDDLKAAGRRVDELSESLRDSYSKFLRHPQVSVMIRHSPSKRVFVGGEVHRPYMVPTRTEITVYDAIVAVGGFTPHANRKRILILRTESPTERHLYEVDLSNFDRLIDQQHNIFLQSGDVILVPSTGIAKVRLWAYQYLTHTLFLHWYVGVRGLYQWIIPSN